MSLIASWKMNDEPAQKVLLESENDLNGASLNDCVSAAGAAVNTNSSLAFNGTTDLVTIPNTPLLNFGTNDFSCTFWVKFDVTASQTCIGFFSVTSRGWQIGTSTLNNRLSLVYADPGGTTAKNPFGDSDVGVKDGAWHHVAVSFERLVAATLWIDGVINDVHPITDRPGSWDITQSYELAHGGGAYFNGGLDDVRIYDTAIVQADVDSIYNDGAGSESSAGGVAPCCSFLGPLAETWGW